MELKKKETGCLSFDYIWYGCFSMKEDQGDSDDDDDGDDMYMGMDYDEPRLVFFFRKK